MQPPKLSHLVAMAETLADDGLGWLPIADRCHASAVVNRLRRGMPVSDEDVHRVREIYARRQQAIAALALDYAWPCWSMHAS